jgi:hypothetical protein
MRMEASPTAPRLVGSRELALQVNAKLLRLSKFPQESFLLDESDNNLVLRSILNLSQLLQERFGQGIKSDEFSNHGCSNLQWVMASEMSSPRFLRFRLLGLVVRSVRNYFPCPVLYIVHSRILSSIKVICRRYPSQY